MPKLLRQKSCHSNKSLEEYKVLRLQGLEGGQDGWWLWGPQHSHLPGCHLSRSFLLPAVIQGVTQGVTQGDSAGERRVNEIRMWTWRAQSAWQTGSGHTWWGRSCLYPHNRHRLTLSPRGRGSTLIPLGFLDHFNLVNSCMTIHKIPT